jgi:pre-mRNA-processing factor 40
MRMIISDKRYGVLRALGERRACFHEWRDQKAKEDREEQRKRKEEARQQLKSLLQASKSVTGSTRYKDVERLFGSKKAWDDLQTVADRHSVIDEVVAERAQEEREQERAEQRKAMQAYKALLDSCDWIVPGTKWRKVDAALEQHSESQALRKEQRLQAFADFAREVEQRAEEKKEAEREERRDKERQNRQDFVQMLEQKKADGQITMKTRWRSFEPKLKEEDSYQAVTSNQEGSRPRELFEDLLEQLSSEVEEYRQSVEVTVNQMMTLPDEYERFAEQVRAQHDIPEPHLRSLWEDSYAPEAETHADNEDDNDKKPRGKKRKHHQKHESAAIPDGEDGEETKRQRREQHTGAFDEEDEEGEIRD